MSEKRKLKLVCRADCPECGASIVMSDYALKNIQSAAYADGAAAQRKADLLRSCIECGGTLRRAPLVEFPDE